MPQEIKEARAQATSQGGWSWRDTAFLEIDNKLILAGLDEADKLGNGALEDLAPNVVEAHVGDHSNGTQRKVEGPLASKYPAP